VLSLWILVFFYSNCQFFFRCVGVKLLLSYESLTLYQLISYLIFSVFYFVQYIFYLGVILSVTSWLYFFNKLRLYFQRLIVLTTYFFAVGFFSLCFFVIRIVFVFLNILFRCRWYIFVFLFSISVDVFTLANVLAKFMHFVLNHYFDTDLIPGVSVEYGKFIYFIKNLIFDVEHFWDIFPEPNVFSFFFELEEEWRVLQDFTWYAEPNSSTMLWRRMLIIASSMSI